MLLPSLNSNSSSTLSKSTENFSIVLLFMPYNVRDNVYPMIDLNLHYPQGIRYYDKTYRTV